ncbi:MAG: type II toxin-antitoxin system RelE/ParE family toxin [Candidatus Neomarinimicrobiota bacterium]
MTYRIELKPAAVRDLKNVARTDQKRIARRINALAADPRPRGSQKLKQAQDLRRIIAGDYRILYQIQDKNSLVVIARIRHRREVYQQL